MKGIVLRFRFDIRRRNVHSAESDCRGEVTLGVAGVWRLVWDLQPMLPDRSSELYRFVGDSGSIISDGLWRDGKYFEIGEGVGKTSNCEDVS